MYQRHGVPEPAARENPQFIFPDRSAAQTPTPSGSGAGAGARQETPRSDRGMTLERLIDNSTDQYGRPVYATYSQSIRSLRSDDGEEDGSAVMTPPPHLQAGGQVRNAYWSPGMATVASEPRNYAPRLPDTVPPPPRFNLVLPPLTQSEPMFPGPVRDTPPPLPPAMREAVDRAAARIHARLNAAQAQNQIMDRAQQRFEIMRSPTPRPLGIGDLDAELQAELDTDRQVQAQILAETEARAMADAQARADAEVRIVRSIIRPFGVRINETTDLSQIPPDYLADLSREFLPQSNRLVQLLSTPTGLPSYNDAMEAYNFPFIESAKLAKYMNWGILKLKNVSVFALCHDCHDCL